MSFSNLRDAAERFRRSVGDACGEEMISSVSVDEPSSDDELGFYKLVLWSYVFWNEACQPAGRHIASILRSSSPTDAKAVATTFANVGFLRTKLAHNLGESTGDQHKQTQANIWLVQNGGEPTDWPQCVRQLSEAMSRSINSLTDHWELLLTSPEDAPTAVERLISEVQHDWPVHTFDPIVAEVARALGLEGLEVVSYRLSRHEDWRKFAKMFGTRAEAEIALRRVVLADMTRTFGYEPSPQPQAP